MGTVTQATERMAESACTHSARLVESRATVSPLCLPNASRPWASSRTISPTADQSSIRHWPPHLTIWAGRLPLVSTLLQNIRGRVALAITSSGPSAPRWSNEYRRRLPKVDSRGDVRCPVRNATGGGSGELRDWHL